MRRERHIDVGNGPWPSDADAWDGYRFGSETCPNLVPSEGGLSEAARGLAPERCVLVTPLLGPEDLDGALRSASAAFEKGWAEVVVNDWGLLAELSRLGARGLCAGRLLMRFRRGPGAGDPWEELDGEARNYFAWGPLYDTPFLAHLRQMRVSRVETDRPRHPAPLPAAGEIALSLHVQTRLISLVASCPWLYDPASDNWGDPRACPRPCRSRGDILLQAEPLAHPLRLRGRALLESTDDPLTEEDLPPRIDRLIFEGLAGC